MDVINCKGCGRLFNALTRTRLCPKCQEKLEEKFQEVKTYINDNPGSTIDVVSEACDVPAKQIKQWVREERLYFTEGSNTGISCEHCGVMIQTGRYCNRCKAEMTNNFRSAIKPAASAPEPKNKAHRAESNKMRYLDSK